MVEKRKTPSVAGSTFSNRKSRTQGDPEGLKPKTARGALITSSLPALQNLIKRAPESYEEEFAAQWARFMSLVKIFQLGLASAKSDEDNLKEVTTFVCQVAHLYPKYTSELPSILSQMLLSSGPSSSASNETGPMSGVSGGGVSLGPETRKTMMQGLVLLRRREVITGIDLLRSLFPLLSSSTSPNLRQLVIKTILSDIKTANLKTKNHKLNRMVQGILFGMIERGIDADSERFGTGVKPSRRGGAKVVGAREAMWAVKIASELWRKNVWRDAKTVSLVATACFHPDTKVQNAALHFFLVTPDADADDEDSDEDSDEGPDIMAVKHRQEINKKRRSTERKAKNEIRTANRKRRQKQLAAQEGGTNFSALQLLNDPQSFGERIYETLVKYDKSYTLDHKVLLMQLFGRVSGMYKLTVLGFYSYILRYLTHHQLQITSILVALAQSCHDLTPPEDLEPVIRKIASEFIHAGVAAEVVAAGLNSVTEICRRQPWCMDKDLLEDLVEYRNSKDKGVMVASRGLLALYREVNPSMLRKRDRGKVATMKGEEATQLAAYGHDRDTTTAIEGLDLLAQHLAEKKQENGEEGEAGEGGEEEDWQGWEVESDGSSDSSGWISVASDDDEDLNISDSSDDEKPTKRQKVASPVVEDKSSQGSGSDDDEDASDDDDEEEEEEGTGGVVLDDVEYDMSLARANKELSGTDFADLATTKILTPADFAKINELRVAAAEEQVKSGGGGPARRRLAALAAARKANLGENDNFLTEGEIIGVRKKTKATYEERMAKIAEGREGREKFRSHKHKKLDEKEHSTTNEEKRRSKPFAMVAASRDVRRKKAASSKQKSKKLRNHIVRLKKGGRRGNKG